MTALSTLYPAAVRADYVISEVPSGDRTMLSSDAGARIVFSAATAQDYLLRDYATVALPVGAVIVLAVADDTAAKTETTPASVVLNGQNDHSIALPQVVGLQAVLTQITEDNWVLSYPGMTS